MISVFKKLTTKPVWLWERRRSYPIRARFCELPALGVQKGVKRFVVLATPDAVQDALWTAWSWYRYLRNYGFSLELAVDGAISDADSAAAAHLFPGILVYSAQSLSASVCEREPRLKTFLYGHPTGRKLALMLALVEQGPVLYSDHDILAFRSPDELLARIDRNVSSYFLEDADGTCDPEIAENAKSLGLERIPRFNCGFLYLPQGSLSIRQAAEILSTWRPPGGSWFAEQTVLSFMLRASNAQALPPERYVISPRRQFYWEKDIDYATIVARHFTGTVRHVMYRYGMPILLRQSRIMEKEQGNA